MAAFDFSSSFSGIHNALGNITKQNELSYQRELLGKLGSLASSGNYSAAAQQAFAAGDAGTGIALLGLGQTENAYKSSPFASRSPANLGGPVGGTPSATAPAPVSPALFGGKAAPRPYDRPVQVAETEDDVARLEAEMESRTQLGYGNPALPAGMRNNNPGNIKFVGLGQAAGVIGPSQNTDQGDPQAVFNSPEAGMAAAHSLALRKYQGGKRTANDLIAGQNGWTPGNAAAAANVARTMGIAPTDDLRLDDPNRATAFLRALALQEHGKSGGLYGDDMIRGAVAGRSGGQPAATQVASAPAVAPAGTYAQSTPEELQGFLNNPRVPENMKGMMREELARRGAGQQPVQVAQAPAQPGAPVSDAPNQPDPAAPNVQGFVIPQGQGSDIPRNDPYPNVSTQQVLDVLRNPRSSAGDRALAQSLYASRQAYSAENAPDKRELTRLQTEKLRRDIEGVLTPEQEAQKIRLAQAGRTQITNSVGAGESAEAKKIGESAGERAGATMSAASAASKQLMRLGQVEALMKNVETGRLQPNRMSIAALGKSMGVDEKFLESIGLDPKGVGDAQALNAISGRMLVDMIGSGGFPANNFSNTDREFLTGTLPSLANDPRANSLLVEVAKRTAQIDIEKAKGWREWKRANPKGSFDDYELEFGDKLGATDRFADLAQKADALTGRQRVVPRGQPAPGATPAGSPPAARPAQPLAPRTATNPNTGERIMLDPATGQWVPYS